MVEKRKVFISFLNQDGIRLIYFFILLRPITPEYIMTLPQHNNKNQQRLSTIIMGSQITRFCSCNPHTQKNDHVIEKSDDIRKPQNEIVDRAKTHRKHKTLLK